MALTKRASDYLKTLRRLPAVPVDEVARALERTGFPVYPAWLEFHEKYAGYVEPLGLESAVLGIVHRDSYWIPPGEASVDTWDEGEHVVTCAEVHPSFCYILFEDGHFWSSGGAGECANYDIKIEQSALFQETIADGRKWGRIVRSTTADPSALVRLREALSGARVDEASDTYNDAWLARDATWLEGSGKNRVLTLWAPVETHPQLERLLDGP